MGLQWCAVVGGVHQEHSPVVLDETRSLRQPAPWYFVGDAKSLHRAKKPLFSSIDFSLRPSPLAPEAQRAWALMPSVAWGHVTCLLAVVNLFGAGHRRPCGASARLSWLVCFQKLLCMLGLHNIFENIQSIAVYQII